MASEVGRSAWLTESQDDRPVTAPSTVLRLDYSEQSTDDKPFRPANGFAIPLLAKQRSHDTDWEWN